MRSLTHLSWEKLEKGRAVFAAVPVAACLLIGFSSGYKPIASIAAGSAFTVGFGAFNAINGAPVLSMTLTSLLIASATVVGSLCGLTPASLYLSSVIVALAAGMLFATGKHASWVGLQSASFFVVAAAFPLGSRYALLRGVLVLAGGATQVALYIGLWSLTPTGGLRKSIEEWKQGAVSRSRQVKDATYFRSPPVQHGIRVALALCASTFLYRHFAIHDGYWIPVTALLVLRPDWSATRSRGIARMSGTLLGAGLASLVVFAMSDRPFVFLLLTIAFTLACFSLQRVNYALFCCVLTFYVVFLLAFADVAAHRTILSRLLCTVVGGSISLLVDGLWPKSLQNNKLISPTT